MQLAYCGILWHIVEQASPPVQRRIIIFTTERKETNRKGAKSAKEELRRETDMLQELCFLISIISDGYLLDLSTTFNDFHDFRVS